MKCEKCGNDSDIFVLLPTRKPDGSLDEIVCHDCALASSAYCQKHQMPHLGFADDETTACRICIEEMIAGNKSRAEEIHLMLKAELPPKEIEDLDDWAQDYSLVTGNSTAVCVLRAIITKALRLGVDINEVVKKIIEAQSVDLILPNIF